ncbi:DUF6431 domain-containing protein [Holdemanella sp. MSK.7.32]|uniref:DUF6431 domain-containing protein n=1 Tax=Holdemanella sp. MSK.7.32 TaxID=2965273 RepID=UPI002108A99C|nr:DUF6431 domain-containing protein [Holdemanella sp. MSK.7.32]
MIIDDISSGDCKIEIPVQRIQCTQCKSTHALLPTNFVPYTQFTYLFIYYIVTLDENDDLITSFEVALHLCSLVNNPLNTHRIFNSTILEANF